MRDQLALNITLVDDAAAHVGDCQAALDRGLARVEKINDEIVEAKAAEETVANDRARAFAGGSSVALIDTAPRYRRDELGRQLQDISRTVTILHGHVDEAQAAHRRACAERDEVVRQALIAEVEPLIDEMREAETQAALLRGRVAAFRQMYPGVTSQKLSEFGFAKPRNDPARVWTMFEQQERHADVVAWRELGAQLSSDPAATFEELRKDQSCAALRPGAGGHSVGAA